MTARAGRVALGGLLLLAAGLRGTALEQGPPVGIMADEWRMSWQGVRVLRGEATWPPPDAAEPLGSWLAAGAFAVAGPTIPVARSVEAAAGVATVAGVWWAARPVLGTAPALFAALVLAVLRWHLLISRIAQPYALLAFATIVALGAVARAGTDGRRRWWVLAGVAAAVGPYAYLAGRALPVVTLIALGWAERRPPRRAAGILTAAVVCALALTPLAVRFASHPEAWASRPGYLVAQLRFGGHPAAAAGRNLLDTLAALVLRGDGLASSGWPDPPPGRAALPAVVTGLALAGSLAAFRTAVPGWNAFLLLTAGQAAVIAAVAGLGWPSGIHRISFLAPLAAACAGAGAARVAGFLPGGWRTLTALVLLTAVPDLPAFVRPGLARVPAAAVINRVPQQAVALAALQALPGVRFRLHRQAGDPDSLHEMFAAAVFFHDPARLAGADDAPAADVWLWRTTEKRDLLRDLLPAATGYAAAGDDAGGQTAGATIRRTAGPGDPGPAELDPLVAGHYRAGELMGERRYAEALAGLDALVAGPGRRVATLHAKRGFALLRLARTADALAAARQAVALGPRNPTALNLAAFLLTTHAGRHAEARQLWRRSLAADPDQPTARANVGQMDRLLSTPR